MTLKKLSAGTFIGEYVGEVISDAEVKRRRKVKRLRMAGSPAQL